MSKSNNINFITIDVEFLVWVCILKLLEVILVRCTNEWWLTNSVLVCCDNYGDSRLVGLSQVMYPPSPYVIILHLPYMRLNITIYKGTLLWPLYQELGFDALRAKNSYSQLDWSNDVIWMSLNYAILYDVILVLSITISHGTVPWPLYHEQAFMLWVQQSHTQNVSQAIILN